MCLCDLLLQHTPQSQGVEVCLLCAFDLHHARSAHNRCCASLRRRDDQKYPKSRRQLYLLIYLDLQQQYLIQLETFLSVDFSIFLTSLLRIMIFLSIVVSLLPAIFYSFAFGKFGVLWETVVGIPAYIFYFPTYTCILPIYAHCRLDDIYSGDTFKSSAAARNQRLR